MRAIEWRQSKRYARAVVNTGGLIVAFCMVISLSNCEADRDSWKRISDSGVLRVGIDPTFPPFALAEEGMVEGLDVDLARSLAAELGLEAQFTYFGYDGLYDALTTEQVDTLISALVVVPERMKDVAYTNPYYDAGQILIVPEASLNGEMNDLDGDSLAVELGSLGHVEALEWERQLNGLSVQTYESVAEALAAVTVGKANAALVDSVSGRLYLRDQPTDATPLSRRPEPVVSEPYAIAVRIEDRTLQTELNKALERLKASGKLDSIINRWLGP